MEKRHRLIIVPEEISIKKEIYSSAIPTSFHKLTLAVFNVVISEKVEKANSVKAGVMMDSINQFISVFPHFSVVNKSNRKIWF